MKNNTRLGGYLFVAPYLIVFTLLILVPTLASVALSFTYFNTVEAPEFVSFENFIQLFTNDGIFMRNALPNTIFFALVVGPVGYFLSFFLAWVLAQVQPGPRKFLALVIYAPSMIGAVLMNVVWRVFFSGDRLGYLNNVLISIGLVNEPVQWLQSPDFLIYIMIFVSIWSSMGLGFLAIMAGILNTDRTLYEAAYIDGLKNKFQEIFYITIPSIRPQMLFGAVMAIVGTMNAAGLGIVLSGANPTPQYAGWLIVDHMADFGFKRMEMGYASALSLVMLLLVYAVARVALKTFREKE